MNSKYKKRANIIFAISCMALVLMGAGFLSHGIYTTVSAFDNVSSVEKTARMNPDKELALRPFDPYTNYVEPEPEPESEPEPEPEPELVSLGEFTIFHFCKCFTCTQSGNGITASGTVAEEGRTIAADWNVIPPGTEVVINGHRYVVEDRGGGIKGNKIDIFVDGENAHARAYALGKYTTEVFVVRE